MGIFLFFLVAAILVALNYGRPRKGFLPDFATVLERPEFVNGFGNWMARRSFLKGEFRGRKLTILLQRAKKHQPHLVLVSMETHATTNMETYEFVGDRADRESALAMYALEVKHELRLRHVAGCLKGRWEPSTLFVPKFDPLKWRSVLEAMATVAQSIERRESSPTVADPR
jgi:hypothetical protein